MSAKATPKYPYEGFVRAKVVIVVNTTREIVRYQVAWVDTVRKTRHPTMAPIAVPAKRRKVWWNVALNKEKQGSS